MSGKPLCQHSAERAICRGRPLVCHSCERRSPTGAPTPIPRTKYARSSGLVAPLWVLLAAALFIVASPAAATDADIIVRTTPVSGVGAEACTGSFVTRYLPHFTTTADNVIRMFQANGSGIAAGDLDGDGDLDLVLGNLHGPDAIFWNQGALEFRKQPFGEGATRAVNVVDVDADGLLDIVLTRSAGAISYWRNQGDGEFAVELLPGVSWPASVLNWADTDRDGDLDLITASYDAGLLTDRGTTFLLDGGAGIVHYRNQDGRFAPQVLDIEAQAMAIALQDLDGDGRTDIMVANDFAVPDRVWLQSDDGWLPASPFGVTSHSTMSIDFGDVNNDGALDLFTTDMMPFAGDASTLGAWHPIMAGMEGEHPPGDPQHMVNVLHVAGASGDFDEQAHDWGVDATGWSWSSKFGDFDNDGFLDLYIVNGMIEERMFGHLPRHELLETNQAFRNVYGSRFTPAPEWGLGSRYSGRGSVFGDFDLDGDLDIAVNNLRGPAQLFENRLCGGDSLQVDLREPASANSRALGARLELVTSVGTLTRDVRAASGYLSGDAPRVHFGLPAGASLERLDIIWPDGAVSTVIGPAPNSLLTIERGSTPGSR